ncbi:hypothetical protein D3C78_1382610 [compost metagenome]
MVAPLHKISVCEVVATSGGAVTVKTGLLPGNSVPLGLRSFTAASSPDQFAVLLMALNSWAFVPDNVPVYTMLSACNDTPVKARAVVPLVNEAGK